jgi:hypothetical protein
MFACLTRMRVAYTFLSQVYDLLNPTHGQISAALARGGRVPGLRVRYSKADDFYVENLFTFECSSPEEVGSPLSLIAEITPRCGAPPLLLWASCASNQHIACS